MGAVRQIFAQHVVKRALQTTVCDHAAVYELQGSGCRVARIGKRLLLVFLALDVKSVECCPWHVDLASDFKLLGPICTLKCLWDIADVLYVFGHIVSDGSVSTGKRPGEFTFLICEADCCSVKLEFAAE